MGEKMKINLHIDYEDFQIVRQTGDHIMMTKKGVNMPQVIKSIPKEVPSHI